MNKLRAEDFVINFELMKRFRFYDIFKPNGSKIYRLLLLYYGVFVNCIVVYSSLGFFVKMEDTLSYSDYFTIIFAMISIFLCSWRFYIFLSNVEIIYDLSNVTRFNFLKSKDCCKNINILCGYRDRVIKITNHFSLFSLIVMSQWILFALVRSAFTSPEDENIRQQNILNLRFPISIHTYNQYYFILYLTELVISVFVAYVMILSDILLMSWCWSIIAQQEVLSQAFRKIGLEDNSQKMYYEDFKSILVDQIRLNLKIKLFYSVVRSVILTYAAIMSTCFIILTYVLIVVSFSKESHSILDIIKLGSSTSYTCVHLFLYCYLFDNMNVKLQSVNTRIYSCDWTRMDVKFKKLLLLTMQMNNANNLMIKASPKKIVNLQLFANIVTMSYNIVSVMLKTTG
ncbi:uncharacterized protein LOC112591739 [Melanaphis sacchari]|uniref:uncharacterized protein LOC112591739 n=1 Tax=Melanaphis sacchari TaxID=742174 RepID=UPI000DC13361|nr:uncharacterized protein LOC112591739 [Melanaphis sacchari]XP_025191438.1 uncharacterized protein LOC112591739 [Melanaphis sacchari]